MPRQKRAEARTERAADALPDITGKQLAFVRGILEGKTSTDAYRAAYDASGMLDETVWAEASRLRHDHKVAAWVSAARQANMDTAKLTIDSHMSELARLRDIAISTGNVGAAVLAETNRGKASGLYTDRIEDVTKRAEDVKSLVLRIAQMDHDAGLAMARALGIAAPDVVSAEHDGTAPGNDIPVTH